MRYLILFLCTSCAALPQPGTPEAARACEQLKNTIPLIQQYEWDDDWARESFILQFAAYREELGCDPREVPLPCGDMLVPGGQL